MTIRNFSFKPSLVNRSDERQPSESTGGCGDPKASLDISNNAVLTGDAESAGEKVTQDGVKKVQATTIVWTRRALIVAYGL